MQFSFVAPVCLKLTQIRRREFSGSFPRSSGGPDAAVPRRNRPADVVSHCALAPHHPLRLTAADFGYLALLMSIVAFANALSDCATLALPVHFAAESEGERRRMIASFFVVTFTVSVALAVLFALSWVTVAGRVYR
ncbi:hypothetical protein [Bradyrhizobium sp. RDT46]|uniref:hypothetical protein n=1 Tax=Bradyrhizobium sp. RDT46 TaxID=3341829 RepID=UPI0035C6B6E2